MRGFARYDRRRLRMLAAECQGKTVLDLGYAQLPNPYFRDLYRVGLDLRRPDEPRPPSAAVYEEEIVGDVAEVDDILRGRLFDNIVAGELIEHLQCPYHFLRAVLPLLAKGGRLVMSTPNPLAFPVVVSELLRSKRFFYTKDHLYYFCPRWVERMLEFSGYGVLAVKGVGIWNPVLPIPCPCTMSYQVVYVAVPGSDFPSPHLQNQNGSQGGEAGPGT